MRAGGWVVVACALLGSVARADTVTLRDGRVLEGRVARLADGRYVVTTRFGRTEVAAMDVLRVTSGATADEDYEAQRVLAGEDPDALEALGAWCRAHGMASRARQHELEAATLRAERQAELRAEALRSRRAKLADGDGAGLYDLARWAEVEGYPAQVVDGLIREALLADPEHAKARVAAELRAREAEVARAEETARDLVAAADAQLLLALQARDEAAAMREKATALLERLEARERELGAAIAAAEQAKRDADARAGDTTVVIVNANTGYPSGPGLPPRPCDAGDVSPDRRPVGAPGSLSDPRPPGPPTLQLPGPR